MKRIVLIGMLLVLGFAVLSVSATLLDWKKLGTRTVKLSMDRDVIQSGIRDGVFKAIKLTVKKSGIHIQDMKVYFRNGDVFDVQVRYLIPAGGETRVIDLPGINRILDKVEFWYDSTNLTRKRAVVELWGLR